jgi:chromosome partitioning protein
LKIISVIQQKGGVGKTTLAINLAHELKAQFPLLRIVVADADPQKSASRWVARGIRNGVEGITAKAVAEDGDGISLRKELAALDAHLIILDLPPSVSNLSLRAALYSNLMLVPVGASVLDVEAMKAAVDVCEEGILTDKSKSFLIVPTKMQSTTTAGRELREVLKKLGPVSKSGMGLRVAYADAATRGEGITTFAPGSAAHEEVKAIAKEASKILGIN